MAEVITSEMEEIRSAIAMAYAKRDNLKHEMQLWYDENPRRHFKGLEDLMRLDNDLSKLDSQYKRLWDYYNVKSS